MGERDEILGSILKDLIQPSTYHIGVLLKNFDSLIFKEDVMFYYSLASQFK